MTEPSQTTIPVSLLLGCDVPSPSLPAPCAPDDILWHQAQRMHT